MGKDLKGGTATVQVIDEQTVVKTIENREWLENELDILAHVKGSTYVTNMLNVVGHHIYMEYGGVDLLELTLSGTAPADEAIPQLVRAVAALHGLGVAHCDIKLENILWDAQASKLKLCDLGMSSRRDPNRTISGLRGTPVYMCPEMLKHKKFFGFYADAWSLGICIVALKAGRFPFRAATPKDELFNNFLDFQRKGASASAALAATQLSAGRWSLLVDLFLIADYRNRALPRAVAGEF